MATPRCPYCNAQGVNQLEAKIVGFFVLIFCKSCGAIHGVIPKPAPTPEPQAMTNTAPEPDLDLHPIPGSKPKPQPQKQVKKSNPSPVNKAGRLTPEEAQARAAAGLSQRGTMYRIIRNVDDEE